MLNCPVDIWNRCLQQKFTTKFVSDFRLFPVYGPSTDRQFNHQATDLLFVSLIDHNWNEISRHDHCVELRDVTYQTRENL